MMRTHRDLLKAVRSLLNKGFDGDQTSIRAELVALGFVVSQSTISRALRRLGARRIVAQTGSVRYEIAPSRPELSYSALQDLQQLVTKVSANESLLVLRTRPGSASLVAAVIDAQVGHEFLGSIAGDDTVFVAPKSTRDMNRIRAKFETLLGRARRN